MEADPAEQLQYVRALQEEYDPKVLFLAECKPELADALQAEKLFPHFDVSTTILYKGRTYGLAVAFQDGVSVSRYKNWKDLEHGTRKFAPYYDRRDAIRAVIAHPELGSVALLAGHISHPQHLCINPGFNIRRTQEWAAHADVIAQQDHFIWLGDTNTFLRRTVDKRLRVTELGASNLSHEGGRTWGFDLPLLPKLLYLDRAVASTEVSERSRLLTVPAQLLGVNNPSDHLAVCVQIA